MKGRDEQKVSVLRLLLAELHNEEIRRGRSLDEDESLAVFGAQAQRHRQSISEFVRGWRPDLVEKEKAELKIVESYLPEPIGEGEVRRLVKEAVAELGASGLKDLGRVMGAVMPKLKGRAEGQFVNRIAREALGAE